MTETIEGRAPRKPPTPNSRPQPGDMRYGHSAVTNGNKLLPGIDGRNMWQRRAKDIIAEHISDLGGVDNTSSAERNIVRRAAVITTELERIEVRFATDKATAEDLDLYQRACGNLRRLLEAVGLQRRARPVQTLAEYLASKQQTETEDEVIAP